MNNNKASVVSYNMHKDVLLNYFFKISALLLGLVSTRLSLSYLGASLYGIWATISSIASWVNYGDLGIGNGLRNELAKAVAAEDERSQKKIISTSFFLMGGVALCLFAVISIVTEILFSVGILQNEIRLPMYITNFSFCMNMFLGISRSIAYGYQKSWLTTLAQLVTVGTKIVGILLLQYYFEANLVAFSIVSCFASTVGNVFVLLFLYKKIVFIVKEKIGIYIDKTYNNRIVGVGLTFFVLQLSGLVLYSSDNLIINTLLSSEYVTKYSIITTVYNTGDNLFAIVLISLWSAVTYAMVRNDYNWIKSQIRKLLAYWGVYSLGVIIVSCGINYLVKIWLGDNAIYLEPSLVALFATYAILTAFGAIFVNVTNGLGRLKLQMVLCIVESILNVPLSIVFAKTLGMGLFGVKLATLICCTGAIIVIPIDIMIYLKKKVK